MVAISRKRVKGGFARRVQPGNKDLVKIAMITVGASVAIWTVFFQYHHHSQPLLSLLRKATSRKETLEHPQLHVTEGIDNEKYNAVAFNILETLGCADLFNKTAADRADDSKWRENMQFADNNNRRRLDEEEAESNEYDAFGTGGNENWDGFEGYGPRASARHLFCLAAFPFTKDGSTDPGAVYWKERLHCDATISRQRAILELWSAARANFPQKDFLKQVLDVAVEVERSLLDKYKLFLWGPVKDEGMEYTLTILNDENKVADHGGIYGLSHNLGPGKTFVDVGSCFGITSIAVALLYPGTRIVSIEAASPNWLIQEFNWICLPDDITSLIQPPFGIENREAKRLLAGVGPVSGGPQFASMLWREDSATSTRSWTPASKKMDADVELSVQMKPWHSLLIEADLPSSHVIDVLNIDCEGCEYNLIPDLTEAEFEAIPTVIGQVHWGYIPKSKLPSSNRAEITHKRLCIHENIARTAKECCAFPDLPVRSAVPGEVLVRDNPKKPNEPFPDKVTVSDISADFCNDFDTWSVEKHLLTITSDWGWFQLTSTAADDI
jgi:hypothetical protein